MNYSQLYQRIEAEMDAVSLQRLSAGLDCGIAVMDDPMARRWQKLERSRGHVGCHGFARRERAEGRRGAFCVICRRRKEARQGVGKSC
jgi:hypothetical protein